MEQLTQYTPEQLEELKLIFKGIYEANELLEELASKKSDITASKRDMVNSFCEKIDIPPKLFNQVFKDYMEKIREPEVSSTKDGVMAFLLTFFNDEEEKK